MNLKQKKELRRHQSTRQLMGIDRLTDHGMITARGELVFFLVRPDNLSVLSAEGVHGRIAALTDLLRGMEEVILAALDSRESFLRNKHCYQERLEEEDVPAVRELLKRDMAQLDEIQSTTASAREFVFICRVEKQDSDLGNLKRLEKRIRDCGFHVRLASEQDIKRLLAVYYQQDVTTEYFENFDGERWVKADG